jgi:hypothetical protein
VTPPPPYNKIDGRKIADALKLVPGTNVLHADRIQILCNFLSEAFEQNIVLGHEHNSLTFILGKHNLEIRQEYSPYGGTSGVVVEALPEIWDFPKDQPFFVAVGAYGHGGGVGGGSGSGGVVAVGAYGHGAGGGGGACAESVHNIEIPPYVIAEGGFGGCLAPYSEINVTYIAGSGYVDAKGVVVGQSAGVGAANPWHKQPTPAQYRDHLYGPQVVRTLAELVPDLHAVVQMPCECRRSDALDQVIVHLNDHCRWTRVQIADWLDTLDLDLRFDKEAPAKHKKLRVQQFDGTKVMEFEIKLDAEFQVIVNGEGTNDD